VIANTNTRSKKSSSAVTPLLAVEWLVEQLIPGDFVQHYGRRITATRA
jgi:hypothetical protein